MHRRLLLKAGLLLAAKPIDTALASKRTLRVDGYVTKKIMEGNFFRYSWIHQGQDVSVGFSAGDGFTSSDALRHIIRRLKHTHKKALMVTMAEKDPYRSLFLDPLVGAILTQAEKMNADPVRLMLSLTQGLPYKPENEYQAWPTETLINVHGDCSDTSVVFAALLERYHKTHPEFGRTPLWVFLLGQTHMAVGVRSHAAVRYSGTYWTKLGEKYFFAETTGTGWDVGQRPPKTLDRAEVVVSSRML